MLSNFYTYKEVVETISQSHLGEGGSSDVADEHGGSRSCDHVSVFMTSLGNELRVLEFWLVLMFGIMKSFCKLERANDSQILAIKLNKRNQQDQIIGHSLVETDELRLEPGLKQLKQVFRYYFSKSEKCPLVEESAMDTLNISSRSESVQGCEWQL